MTVPSDIEEDDVEDAIQHVLGDAVVGVLTPEEHQTLKSILNGQELQRIKNHEHRYLVVGAGDDSDENEEPSPAAKRRELVYDRLDRRETPPSVAMQLEDFGIESEQMALWWGVFDILCGRASHIVAVIEDFDGGYTWELGMLASPAYLAKTWVLKRQYSDDETEREKYDNGMAASHLAFLLRTEHGQTWRDERELKRKTDNIP
ncbi:hypothetical protein [Haladaptatus sp. DJG-WS-42]|uniref:hypothetical protein n=1 Tax=Haladaptatus sp. DJG-WS-42 TaxID=3120516 RepID=UPI0030D0FA62